MLSNHLIFSVLDQILIQFSFLFTLYHSIQIVIQVKLHYFLFIQPEHSKVKDQILS